jgi:hypothetical protein
LKDDIMSEEISRSRNVRELVGQSAGFDFGQDADQLPRLDLPDLRPFLHAMLALNRRKVRDDDDGLSFKTPEEWLSDPAVRTSYQNLTFDRHDRSRDATQRVLGVGHPALDQALRQALALTSCATMLPRAILDRPLAVFQIIDRVTGGSGQVHAAIVGVACGHAEEEADEILVDWQLLARVNLLIANQVAREAPVGVPGDAPSIGGTTERARSAVERAIPSMDLHFRHPAIDLVAILWPS